MVFMAFIAIIIPVKSQEISEELAVEVATIYMSNKSLPSMEVANVLIEECKGQNSFYVINFIKGGWIMVSSTKSATPILAYGLKGSYQLYDEKPPAFDFFIDYCKEAIEASKKSKAKNLKAESKWEKILNREYSSQKKGAMGEGVRILNSTSKGELMWGQSYNFSGSCYHDKSYNKYGHVELLGDCGICDPRAPMGCVTVALAQIMWYWQWPESCSYGSYDWDGMPTYIDNSTTISTADKIAQLLKDVADEVILWYTCSGTAGSLNKSEDALIDIFGYEASRRYHRNDWSYGDSWMDLLRSEIDNGRPIQYAGGTHAWVIDGYSNIDNDMFYMNFGHPGVSWQPNPYNYSSLFLDYIAVETSSGDSSNWTNNQRGVIGISPTADFPENINDLNYTVVSFKAEEKAEVGISVPSSGEQLTVMSNGDLSLVAGNSITIQPGFKVESGGIFTAKIEEQSYFNVDIELISCPTAFTPNGDGINDELTIVADNANSWEFTAFNRWGSVIFQSAGSITGDSANIWDGTDSMPSTTYYCVLRLKNSFGRDLEEEITVLVL